MFEWLKNEGDKINLLPKYILNLSLLNPCCHCPTSAITFFFPLPSCQLASYGVFLPLLPYPLTLIFHVTIHVPKPIYLPPAHQAFFSSVHLICYSASLQPQILFPCSVSLWTPVPTESPNMKILLAVLSSQALHESACLVSLEPTHRMRLSSVHKQSLYQRMETCERKRSLAVASGGGQGGFSGI